MESELGLQRFRGCLTSCFKGPTFSPSPGSISYEKHLVQLQEARYPSKQIPNTLSQSPQNSLKAALCKKLFIRQRFEQAPELLAGLHPLSSSQGKQSHEDSLHQTGSKTAFFSLRFEVFYCCTSNTFFF